MEAHRLWDDHWAHMMMRLSGISCFITLLQMDTLPQDSKKRSASLFLTRPCRPPKECKLQASAVKLWLGKIEREEASEEKEKSWADKGTWAITAHSFIQSRQRHSEGNTRAGLRRRFTLSVSQKDKGKIQFTCLTVNLVNCEYCEYEIHACCWSEVCENFCSSPFIFC